MSDGRWQYIGNFGDIDFYHYDGFFVQYSPSYGYRAISVRNLYEDGLTDNEEKTSLEWIELDEKDIDELWNEAKTISDFPIEDLPKHEQYARKLQDIYYYYGFYHIVGEKPEIYNSFRELREALLSFDIPKKELTLPK